MERNEADINRNDFYEQIYAQSRKQWSTWGALKTIVVGVLIAWISLAIEWAAYFAYFAGFFVTLFGQKFVDSKAWEIIALTFGPLLSLISIALLVGVVSKYRGAVAGKIGLFFLVLLFWSLSVGVAFWLFFGGWGSFSKDIKLFNNELSIESAYHEKILIRDIEVGESYLSNPKILGEVKNIGEMEIKTLTVVVYLLGENGAPVFEKNTNIVDYGSFLGDKAPLRPNYSKKFTIYLSDVTTDWSGKVDIQITDIEIM